MILVTGATGQFGQVAIDSLLAKGIAPSQITALVRSEAAAEKFTAKGIQIAIGDYNDYPSLVQAFKGVEKLLFISGSDVMNRSVQHQNVVKAAQEANVQYIVYTSVQRKNETANSPLWVVAESHLQTEQWLRESGIPHTILKNTLYMDFIPAFVGEHVFETGSVYLPAGDGKVSAVLRAEMAEATANVLLSPEHAGKVYDFTHNEAFSYNEVADILSQISGNTIQYTSPTAEAYAETLSKFGLPAEAIGIFSGFAVAQAQGELDITSNQLETLLGRKPTKIQAYLNKVYAKPA
jgi:NAD(P)H dehydrogenase (quinone)